MHCPRRAREPQQGACSAFIDSPPPPLGAVSRCRARQNAAGRSHEERRNARPRIRPSGWSILSVAPRWSTRVAPRTPTSVNGSDTTRSVSTACSPAEKRTSSNGCAAASAACGVLYAPCALPPTKRTRARAAATRHDLHTRPALLRLPHGLRKASASESGSTNNGEVVAAIFFEKK